MVDRGVSPRDSDGNEDHDHDHSDVVLIEHIITGSDSPRLDGVNVEHVRALAERVDELPPITVHRESMRVVDGMHRLRAALSRGRKRIAVTYVHGSESESFVLAVRANISHGLPLSLADRTAAATRIMNDHAEWSDRKIAEVTGLAHQTIGEIRRRASGESDQLHARIGRDGKLRPVNSARARKFAAELIANDASLSLRQLARAAGISTGTARDVRKRVQRGDDPVPPNQRVGAEGEQSTEWSPHPAPHRAMDFDRDVHPVLGALRNDPTLRFTETGRRLLRLLNSYTVIAAECEELAKTVPEHSRQLVTEIAHAHISIWHRFASLVEGTRFDSSA